MSFLGRFFKIWSKQPSEAWPKTTARRPGATRFRAEALEDRQLLSIAPAPHAALVNPNAIFAANPAPAIVASEASGRASRTATTDTSAAAATHFVILLPSGTTAGVPVTVQIIADDAQNHPVSDYAATVDLSSSDPAASLPSSVIFDHGHASFQVTFVATGQQTITAVDEDNAMLTATVTTNVAKADVATHFVLYQPSGAKTNSPVTVQVLAEDVENHLVKTYSGTADLASSDLQASLPASVTFDHGHASFQISFATAGVWTVSAKDEADALLAGTATTSVVAPAVAEHFAIVMRQGTAIGSPVTVQLIAEDAQNHPVSNYNGTVELTSSDTGASLPATVTFANGRATFQVMFSTPGQQSVTATDTTSAISGIGWTNVEIPHFTIQLPAGVTVGKSVTVYLAAMDDQNRFLPGYSGTATVATSDTAASLPTTVTFVKGRASFQVTFNTTGPQTISVSDGNTPPSVGMATTNVAAAPVATHFVLTMTPGATVGEPTTVRVVAEDAQNHIVSNYSGTVTVTSSDLKASLPATLTFENGKTHFFQVTFGTEGTQSVTLADSMHASLSGTTSTNVAAEAVATHFVVYIRPGTTLGEPATVLIVAEDDQNHVVANYSNTIALTSTDVDAKLPATVEMHNGIAKFTVAFATLGSQTITATDSNGILPPATATTNVAAAGLRSDFAGFFGGRQGTRETQERLLARG